MSRKLSQSVKKTVAYKQQYKCGICLILLPSSFQVDHIIPHSITQDDTVHNLQALCPNCHSVKTQRENIRISQFKRLKVRLNKNLCWFCLKEADNKHKCNKTMKDITDILYNTIQPTKETNLFSEFSFTPQDKKNDDTLYIEICFTDLCIYINNIIYKTNNNDITTQDILDAITFSTKNPKFNNKYNAISIKFKHENKDDVDDMDEDICFDHIIDNLSQHIPLRIFNTENPFYILE